MVDSSCWLGCCDPSGRAQPAIVHGHRAPEKASATRRERNPCGIVLEPPTTWTIRPPRSPADSRFAVEGQVPGGSTP
jgi:hypothetical protein